MEHLLNNFFLQLPEEEQSVLLFMRKHILQFSEHFTEHYKFNTPFYYYKGKWNCYLYHNKKSKRTYIAFLNGYLMKHKALLAEGRTQGRVYYFDCKKDIDIKTINELLDLTIITQEKKLSNKKFFSKKK